MSGYDTEKIWSPREIVLRYQSGERNFRSLTIEDADPFDAQPNSFQNVVLDGSDFSHCLIVADFAGASLRGSRFTNANVKTCNFANADLRECDFGKANLDAAIFSAARLHGAHFQGATIQSHTMGSGEVPES
jgi:uncharacterized protein YjbI with pentapeptide repeats